MTTTLFSPLFQITSLPLCYYCIYVATPTSPPPHHRIIISLQKNLITATFRRRRTLLSSSPRCTFSGYNHRCDCFLDPWMAYGTRLIMKQLKTQFHSVFLMMR
ncbi:hypothetical protein QVD17_34556 [Tagetes erecta]|uniref:Uncharacterized protein n=1 Tax=Tagetes erecta TaxID=13708 RepID=A0AAD8NLQ4_TARER|nr:hypothetical protein QVD17_34556 [Tagetes erecta]